MNIDVPDDIRANLITCRNLVSAGKHTADVREALAASLEALPMIEVPMTRSLLEIWLPEALAAYDSHNDMEATTILNFLHNLPLTESQVQVWNHSYFLTVELPEFLGSFEIEHAPTEELFNTLGFVAAGCRLHCQQ
ncbi:hypothetical protein SAMN02800694_1451 [Luteibacter sp. UNCMF331Sha3.1]|uniref:hypothetical protein n=1 Tax=Luteibacter sp. UNCMF331Sha3.1 TaxID=1502760 RepID=UPI0008D2924B|nr:hypothetical protein [Luteibacter sp. UNCMF331Sha3.1]SEM54342.1 hypothetical protein SAMN02800694_1451 [Luteibacter sp. UNCMF331Sha3.1]